MNQIILTQKQMEKIGEIASMFKTVPHFKLESDSLSGICTSVSVTFNMFNESDPTKLFNRAGDTKIDITDISEW